MKRQIIYHDILELYRSILHQYTQKNLWRISYKYANYIGTHFALQCITELDSVSADRYI